MIKEIAMTTSMENINSMDIECHKAFYLVDGAKLLPGGRALISWHDDFLLALLKELFGGIQIDCLMDMDFAAFVQEEYSDKLMIYDYIFDNGLLTQTNMDAMLLRAMGMHLILHGRLRTVLPAGMDRYKMAHSVIENNFGNGEWLSLTEAGAYSFAVAEFSAFNRDVTWLQSFYTDDFRRKLVYLLQRLDFGLDVEDTLSALRQLCCQQNVTSAYLSVMADIATIHDQHVNKMLFHSGCGEL